MSHSRWSGCAHAKDDEFVMHIDGYLCEIKDVQIRDGLHILGGGPVGEPRVNL
ncbi:cobaltochelatase subunit CobN, partial [Streptomyces sp. NPDC000851]